MAIQAPTIVSFFPGDSTGQISISAARALTLTGTAQVGATIGVYDGAVFLGSAVANAAGVWHFPTFSLSDATHSFTATAADASGSVSPHSLPKAVTVVPNVTAFAPTSDNWSTPIFVGEDPYYLENANQPWSVTNPDPHTLRFEVRPGDLWAYDASSRSEIGGTVIPEGTVINVSYRMTLEPGLPNLPPEAWTPTFTPLAWLVLGQFHLDNNAPAAGGGEPPFLITMRGEKMEIQIIYAQPGGTQTYKTVYSDPYDIQRGHDYAFRIEVRFDNDGHGFLHMWRDGIQIVDYLGSIGYGAGVYWKEGIYEGWSSDVRNTIAADYSDLTITTGQLHKPSVADLNHDGSDDVVFQSATDGQVVFRTMSAGMPWEWHAATAPLGQWKVGGYGDVNGDGFADVLVQDAGTGRIYAALQSGTDVPAWIVISTGLSSTWKLVTAGDINGDGFVDAVVQNQLTGAILFSDLTGQSAAWRTVNDHLTSAWKVVGAGDLNGDGSANVVLQQQATGTIYYANLTNGVFFDWRVVSGQLTPDWRAKAVADVNADGFADVIVQQASTGTTVYANMKDGTFSGWSLVTNAVDSTWEVKSAADVTHDGYADVIFQHASDGVTYYANMSGGHFIQWGTVATSSGAEWHVV